MTTRQSKLMGPSELRAVRQMAEGAVVWITPLFDHIEALQEQVATLTAERDAARAPDASRPTASADPVPMALPSRLLRWWPLVSGIAPHYGLDPLLVLAIMDRESLGGDALTTKGPDGTGDGGHGRGLMQIDDRAHPSFVTAVDDTGAALWKDPALNVAYACRLLSRLMRQFTGNPRAAVAAYNTGAGNVKKSLNAGRSVDATTAHGNYSEDVMRRRDSLAGTGKP